MKKFLAFFLAFCLCVGLCACGKENSAQQEYPKDWDRIAEATATINQYYACKTKEEFKSVIQSTFSDDDLKMIMDSWLNYRETWSIDTVGISEQYARKIKYIETYKDYDLFLVVDGYVYQDGKRTPDDPIPPQKHTLAVTTVSSGHLLALTIEGGRYVLANVPADEWQNYIASICVCTCDLGTVVVPGDPCKGCGGAGVLTEQHGTDVEKEDNDICATCGGSGLVEDRNNTEDISNPDELIVNVRPCPDCSGNFWPGSLIIGPGSALTTPCSDCEGTGLENYTLGDCPDCSGQGYTKVG